MKTWVVTGSASGIGAATAAHLTSRGDRVIGVDRIDADVIADLSTPAGRTAAAAQVMDRTDVVDGVVPCAGIAGLTGVDSALLVSVNYFGATEFVTALRPLMAASAGASVVMLASNSVSCQPGWPAAVADACLAGDEASARATAADHLAVHVYPAAKSAIARWARRAACSEEWAGIRVNAVAPGLIATPMTDQLREDPELGVFADLYPSALGRPGQADEVAATIGFLLSAEASLITGSVVYVDGGTDALMHPDRTLLPT